jgi:AcrR family transcriptional regulator
MAKNKSGIDRDAKHAEIVEVARRLFIDAGYDQTSMSRLAEEAGVAPNTIYWYFADKDALLVAVLDSLLSDALSAFVAHATRPAQERALEADLGWLFDELERLKTMIATVHARVSSSKALRAWHDNFHQAFEAVLSARLAAYGVPASELAAASRVSMFVVEGLVAHPTYEEDRRVLVKWLTATLDKALAPELRRRRSGVRA